MNKYVQRVGIVLQLVLAVVSVPFKRTVQNRVPKRLLVIQMAKLGDMVCTTPLFRAVKKAYPEIELTVLGNAVNAEVLAGNPHVDVYIKRPTTFLQLVRVMNTSSFDAVCITVPDFTLLAACIVARIPIIVAPQVRGGRSPYETRPYVFLRKFVDTAPHHMGSYAPREYLRLLEPIGIRENNTQKEVYVSEDAKIKVEHFFTEARIQGYCIGILPGAGNEIKSWKSAHYATLISHIHEIYPHMTFILLGTGKDAERALHIMETVLASVRIVNAIDAFTIEELKACIARLYMVIGSDTGPQYIAEALGVPTIDIVGPVDEREQPPIGHYHKIVKAEREKPELYVLNARVYNREEAQRQIDSITPEMVFSVFTVLHACLEERATV